MDLADNIFSNIHVLIIGDCMLDQYMRGNSGRKSPEADIPILENVSLYNELGGAANVAKNIVQLGARATLLSVVGEDKEAETIKTKLRQNKINHELIIDRSRCTTVKTRLFDNEKPLLRVDREIKTNISTRVNKNVISKFHSLLEDKDIDIIILQDYNKGVLNQENISVIIDAARNREIFIAVDPKINNFNLYKHVNLFKPNLKELTIQYEKSESDKLTIEEIEVLAHMKAKEIACTTFLVTLSERGAMIIEDGVSSYKEAIPIEVVDVCGAGDAVIAISTLSNYKGMNGVRLLELCIKTGEIVCKKTGVSGITMKEINK